MPVQSQEGLDAIVGGPYHARMLAVLPPLVTPEILAEYAGAPLGQHSDALQRLLNYFGSLPIDGKLIVEHDGAERWFVSRLAGWPATSVDRIAGPLPSEEAALDAVFRRRVQEVLGLDPGGR